MCFSLVIFSASETSIKKECDIILTLVTLVSIFWCVNTWRLRQLYVFFSASKLIFLIWFFYTRLIKSANGETWTKKYIINDSKFVRLLVFAKHLSFSKRANIHTLLITHMKNLILDILSPTHLFFRCRIHNNICRFSQSLPVVCSQ